MFCRWYLPYHLRFDSRRATLWWFIIATVFAITLKNFFLARPDKSLKFIGGRVWTYCFLALWWVSTEFWFCWTGGGGDDTISYFTTLSWCWWWKRYDNDDDYDVMMFQYHFSPWSATASLELPAKYNSIKNVKWSQTLFFRLNNWRQMHLRLSKSLSEICHSSANTGCGWGDFGIIAAYSKDVQIASTRYDTVE